MHDPSRPFTFDPEAIDPDVAEHLEVTQRAIALQTTRLAEVEAELAALPPDPPAPPVPVQTPQDLDAAFLHARAVHTRELLDQERQGLLRSIEAAQRVLPALEPVMNPY